MNKNILIVGAGFGQLPAIETAKQCGIVTIVVDKNPEAIGAKRADFFYPLDVLDREGILEIAKKHKIDGAITMQSDLPVPTIGFINDCLNLKGVSLGVANCCSNKIETRRKLKLNSAAQPNFEIISTIEEVNEAVNRIGLPCVIKAPDSSGSRGIIKVNNENEVLEAYNEAFKYSREKFIIVEEFIDGLEFGAQTFSVDSECLSVLLHGDTMSNPPFMIPVGHSFPFSLLKEVEMEMAIQDIKSAINALGIKNGPANVDLILDKKTNRVKVIEIGARIGATCLPELVKYYSGIDWVKATILNAIGERVDLNPTQNKPVAAIIIESPKDGIFEGYTFDSNYTKKDILEFEVTVGKGDEVNILRKGTDRIGKILAYGSTAEEAERKVKNIRSSLRIEVR